MIKWNKEGIFCSSKFCQLKICQGILQHDLSLMLVIHSMLSLSQYCLAIHFILSNIWNSLTICTDLWSEDYAEVPACFYRFKSWSKRQQECPFLLTACEITYCNSSSHLRAKFNRISVKWLSILHLGGLGPISLGSTALFKKLGSVQVECWREEWVGLGQLARPQNKCWE